MNRRTFLAALAGAGSGLAMAGSLAACGAPSPTQGRRMTRIGLQLYTVRDVLARDVDRTLAYIAAVGYDDVELAGYHGRSPAAFATALQRHGLAAPSSHVAYPADADAWDRILDDAAAGGHAWVVIPWLPPEVRATLDGWRRVADRLNECGAAARDRGLRLAYHNHDFEFAAVGATTPYALLIDRTDPALVAHELDVYWMTKAGHDPAAWLTAHPGRYVMTHLKDSGGPPTHPMRDVGAGTIDFPRILGAAAAAGVAHHFIEHDEPGDPLASVAASHRYLARLRY